MNNEISIIGGGIIGLALAVELKQRGVSVTVLSRDSQQAATQAAAGMLAPQAERIPAGAMFDLCVRSRSLYPDWTSKLEALTGLDTEYWPCGILSPRTADDVADRADPNATAQWFDRDAIHRLQPGLGASIVGGWWFPEDGQVNNRAVYRVLHAAARELDIDIRDGVSVEGMVQQNGRITSLQTNHGRVSADRYVMATGAWTHQHLPLPVVPRKGQMLAVRAPVVSGTRSLNRVLFGRDTYIVPRRDGSIVIGATSETVDFTPGNTPDGVHALLDRAIALYPGLREATIDELWWGFRPATPDENPLLGYGHCHNLIVATGHYRNGILLAPITAQLIADLITADRADPLLTAFDPHRFDQPSPTPPPALIVQPTSVASVSPTAATSADPDRLTIAGRSFRSRLMTGSGKYRNFDDMRRSIDASGCEIITVAVRRVQTNAPGHEGLAEALDWNKLWMLPNTAGCQTAEDAIRVARLGREMAKLLGQEDNNFVKLEVISDPKYLLPDPIGTLQAAEQLVKEGFAVLPYINADPILAKHLENAGCATVMPLGSPIGSGQGIQTIANIRIIIENATIPVVVDAGIGTPSEAAQAMELGADAVLINSAIALAQDAPMMAKAMGLGVEAGRAAYRAGRIPIQDSAIASSPTTGQIHP
ncbi:MAG: glycine oxidase ThiO [Oscillatoriales cyanobacterium]|nr:MAG: glycine oxidase ThiO [Oscillatoriales cyanobacterium]